MERAIIYTRVSTDEQAEKGYSLRDQKQRLEKYCLAHKIEIIKHFEDDHSAKTFNRPEFNKLLEYLHKNKGHVTKLLIVKWDRFSRNMEASLNMISKLMKLNVTVEAIEQPLDENVPENLLMKAFYLAAPQVENARRSLNTTNGMRRALLEGRYVSTAPYGFKNARDEMNKPIIKHSSLAPLIKKAFELIYSGTWQIEPLRKTLYNEGLKVSRSNFYSLLRNPIYCGKIRIKAFRDEPQQIVQGIHEPIVSETLFYGVQDILNGKKKSKHKYSSVNDAYPLRGYLICPQCGKSLTGSSALGNGGKYYYYHCTKGCNERHKNDIVHGDFENWLGEVKTTPELAAVYHLIIEDIFKQNDGDNATEIKKLQKSIDDNNEFMNKTRAKFINDDIDKSDFNAIKERISQENIRFESKISDLKNTESGFSEYCRFGLSLACNMDEYYKASEIEEKQLLLGLIFPEKLKYFKNKFQTINPNEIQVLLFNMDKGSRGDEKEKSSNFAAQSSVVIPLGLEPRTPTLKVSCSTN